MTTEKQAEGKSVAFKDWLKMMGYDLGLQDELLAYESAWGKTMKLDVFRLADQYMKDVLTRYTEFLLGHSYCDADVYCEPPSAIDRFLFPELR